MAQKNKFELIERKISKAAELVIHPRNTATTRVFIIANRKKSLLVVTMRKKLENKALFCICRIDIEFNCPNYLPLSNYDDTATDKTLV